MRRPKLTLSGVLVAVLAACAVALTLAGPSSAATSTYSVTGGVPAPYAASAPQPQSTKAAQRPSSHRKSGGGGVNEWLIIAIVAFVIVILVVANIYVPAGR